MADIKQNAHVKQKFERKHISAGLLPLDQAMFNLTNECLRPTDHSLVNSSATDYSKLGHVTIFSHTTNQLIYLQKRRFFTGWPAMFN